MAGATLVVPVVTNLNGISACFTILGENQNSNLNTSIKAGYKHPRGNAKISALILIAT
jgi:hypothetical protein